MSFEFFPPKDDAGTVQLLTAIEALQSLRPDFVSVTYGATGSSRERTIDATKLIAARSDAITMGHLTCVSQSVAELEGAIDAYAQAGVSHILALRGDPPDGPTAAWQRHPDGLDNATELVELVRSRGDFCVGVAAFPMGIQSITISTWMPAFWPPRNKPGRSSRSPSCSSMPTPTSGWWSGCGRWTASCRSSPASCR